MARHVVLFGDSILDNASYVEGWPDVSAQLRAKLDPEDRVTLLAVDGSICEQAERQLDRCPADATHAILSSGGNDILHHAALLEQDTSTVGSAMALLLQARAEFEPLHRALVERAGRLPIPVAVCTIYDADMGPLIATAMGIFNDAISRNIHREGLDLIDLRIVCDEAADYANAIEPSVAGGAKIATAIASYVTSVSDKAANSRVFA
ncbi:SGNH/GDSL hydrolase family protein [Aurantiacibacter sp. MUD11]|uniref:SGNH/GDSL hydrolase family protein n=1 Tax=Aurantiacibacter sp. MUD11 TaxID=3003265 RepID=UPI0022AACC6A|nr:SGNH/GDSL hydrolase family protein [Aurantiacibacter sp. MUD11]WAT18118.1 SGNH/GDSL hydrolase family protein [Aurantiacibacter sp. MUD11]